MAESLVTDDDLYRRSPCVTWWQYHVLDDRPRPTTDDRLTGDAGGVAAFAATWDNIATHMQGVSDELTRILADLDDQHGLFFDTYGTDARFGDSCGLGREDRTR